jgi:hypothetical protein
MRSLLAVIAVVLLAPAPEAAAQDTLSVHVRGVKLAPMSKETEVQLKQKVDAARQARDELEEAGRKQFGKDPEKWPAEKREAVQAAHETFVQAQAAWFYVVELAQKDIDDSVSDLEKALADKKGVRATTDAAAADLVLEVVGRARVQGEGWGGSGAPESRLVFKAIPGPGLDVATLSKSAASWDAKAGFWSKAATYTWHRLTPEQPYWLLMSRKPGTGWMASYKSAAGEAAKAVEKFAQENASALAAARGAHD